MTHGLQFQSSYTFARNLSEEGGINPTANASETGGSPSDIYHPGLDYGNVIYTRRHRFMASFLYDLPFGHNKMFASNAGFLVNSLINDWQLAGYYLQQSGPFLTPITSTQSITTTNPDGSKTTTNYGNPMGNDAISKGFLSNARPDRVAGVSAYGTGLASLNKAAFVNPLSNIGRQGTASVGSVVGFGTNTFSMSLMKSVAFTEQVKLQVGAQVQNLLNHHNYDVPSSLDITTANFGVISSVQTKDNAGPRAISLTARLSF
jgi:hypothetical protein